MADFKGVPTDKLQAQYDARVEQIRALREENEPLKQELSARCNALAFIRNQVIAGQAASLLANGVSPQAVEEAELYVKNEKERKAAARAVSVGGAS